MSSKLAVEVVIEVPKWGFVKRGMHEHVDFVSPVPCPFNYGSVDTLIGLDGDLHLGDAASDRRSVVTRPVGERVLSLESGIGGVSDRAGPRVGPRPPESAERP